MPGGVELPTGAQWIGRGPGVTLGSDRGFRGSGMVGLWGQWSSSRYGVGQAR